MVNFFEYWHYLQPFLFGLIGTEIDLSALDGHTIGLGLVVLVIGVLVCIKNITDSINIMNH